MRVCWTYLHFHFSTFFFILHFNLCLHQEAQEKRFASFAFWLSVFLHFYHFYSNFAVYWFTGIVCTVSPPQAVVGRGAVVALLSFQRTNPEDALLHCVQQCVVTRVQMVYRTRHCVEGPMSENQSRGCALLQYIVILLDSRAAFFQSANLEDAWKMRCVGLHRALLLFFSVWGHISKS